MSKLADKTNGLLLSFFVKLHLVYYDSFISDTYTIGLVHTLLLRFLKICSSMENFHIEVELLRSIFKCNNYAVNIIDRCIKKFFDKLYEPKQVFTTMQYKSCFSVQKSIE